MAYRTTIRSLCQMYVGDVSHQSVLAGYWSDHVGVEWPTAPQLDLCVICISVGDVSHHSHIRVSDKCWWRIIFATSSSSGESHQSRLGVPREQWRIVP